MALPKASRRREFLRPLWVLGMLLYVLSQLVGSSLVRELVSGWQLCLTDSNLGPGVHARRYASSNPSLNVALTPAPHRICRASGIELPYIQLSVCKLTNSVCIMLRRFIILLV